MSKIQMASDLHLEFEENRKWLEENPIISKGEVLLLAGDIIPDKYKKKAQKFYAYISDEFPVIVSTMGNHEFYHGTLSYAYPSYSGRVGTNHLKLNNASIVIGDTKIIASTLWTDILKEEENAIEHGMNDYRLIHETDIYGDKIPLSAERIRQFHARSMHFLKDEILIVRDARGMKTQDFNG